MPTWLLAGLGATGSAAAVALLALPATMPTPVGVVLSALLGWLVLLLLAPWPAVAARRDEQRKLRRLTACIRGLSGQSGPESLRKLIIDQDDELGELSKALHELIGEVISNRRAAERLKRDMGESIRRETHRQTIRLKKEAFTDPLTGLGNRRALEQRLQDLCAEEVPPGMIVAMVADLDHFKQVNDTLGHETGDACLVFLGELLQSSIRRADTAIRLGGDEFVVLMPGQNLETARRVAERLASLFQQMPWPHTDVPKPGLSIGLGLTAFENLGDGRRLLRDADEALYRASAPVEVAWSSTRRS